MKRTVEEVKGKQEEPAQPLNYMAGGCLHNPSSASLGTGNGGSPCESMGAVPALIGL